MTHDWILDVLTDLRSFALSNGMTALAEQLDDTKLVASAEVASLAERARIGHAGDDIAVEPYLGGFGAGGRA